MHISISLSIFGSALEDTHRTSRVRRLAAVASLLFAYGWFASQLHALTIFETATLGPTGLTSNLGVGIYYDQFLGARFELTSSVTTTAIGGHFGTTSVIGNNQFF